MILSFADCALDADRRQLRRQGQVVHVEPQVFDLLMYLANHADRVVTKEELLQAVWDGRFVSEAALSSRISSARRAIGDSGDRQALLRTVPRLGFRFHVPVERQVEIATSPARSNLPVQTTSVIGREAAANAIATQLTNFRIITLTGPGGVGKTTLALHVASQVASLYPDGVYLTEFASATEPAAAAHALAATLHAGMQQGKDVPQSLAASLADRRILLLFDNCEHLIDAIAGLAQTIVSSCPSVTILATSREPFAMSAEQEWPVSPLVCGGPASPAARLFSERAQAIAPDFDLSAHAPAVMEICRRLDGIPLAIELAAARTRSLSPSQIRDRIGEGTSLLRSARHTHARHADLHNAIRWSYDLLTPVEQTLLQRLSVFVGGFSLEAAESIAQSEIPRDSVLDLLDSLVRKSLVTVERSVATVHYGLLETIRQFAAEEFAADGDEESVRRRHAQFFAEDSDTHFRLWRSPEQALAYIWLDREIGNLRTAFRWASEQGEVDLAARIASNIGDMGRFRLQDEGAAWAAEVIESARRVRHPRLVVLLTWAASTAWSLGELEQARLFAREALDLEGDGKMDSFVWAFTDLAMVEAYEGRADSAIDLARAGARHPADRQDRMCLAMLPYFLAIGGLIEEARNQAESIAPDVEATGIPSSISIALWAQGKALASSEPKSALAAFDRCIMIAKESGNRLWEAMGASEAAALERNQLDPAATLEQLPQIIDQWRQSADRVLISHGIGSLIVLLERLEADDAAAVLSGAVSSIFTSNPFVAKLSDATQRVRHKLGDADFEKASDRGAAMELHEVYDYAMQRVEQLLRDARTTLGQSA